MCKFGWYRWYHYFDDSKVSMLPFQKECMGRVIGPTNNGGNDITQWIIKDNGKIIPIRNLKKLTDDHLYPRNEVAKVKRDEFGNKARSILGESIDMTPSAPSPTSFLEGDYEVIDNLGPSVFDGEEDTSIITQDDFVDNQGRLYLAPSVADTLIFFEVLTPQRETLNIIKLLCQAIYENGKLIGINDENSLLNTMAYNVELPDDAAMRYGANIIAENILISMQL